jgi:hypothetical protein
VTIKKNIKNTITKRNTRPQQPRGTLNHNEQEEHKTMMIKRNTKAQDQKEHKAMVIKKEPKNTMVRKNIKTIVTMRNTKTITIRRSISCPQTLRNLPKV